MPRAIVCPAYSHRSHYLGRRLYLWHVNVLAGSGDSPAGFSLKAGAENELCHLSVLGFNSNGACAFSPLNLQPSAWTLRQLNASSSYKENIVAAVSVLQGLFTILIKQADW